MSAPRLHRLRLAWLPIVLVASCHRSEISDVPTLGEGTCRIRVGETRSVVLLRCGPPCGGGTLPDGLRCDVHGSAEICYREGTVVSVNRLAPLDGRFRWCTWEEPAPAGAR